jgi:hypothetical protein
MATENKASETSTVTTREANGKKKVKIGALWKRVGQSGGVYFTGEISNGNDDVLGNRTQVVGFVRRAADKKDKDGNARNYPDIELYLSERAAPSLGKESASPSSVQASSAKADSLDTTPSEDDSQI